MSEIETRAYGPDDRAACLAIFDSNVPTYLASEERREFEEFLDIVNNADCPYLVLTQGRSVVACGGLFIETDKGNAALSWGMVDRGLHRQKLGTRLTEARLAQARMIPGIDRLTLATSQHTQGFYATFGFVAAKVTPDGLAPGLDRWDMVLQLR